VYNDTRKGGEKQMTNLGNKEVMAKNLRYYVKRSGKTQKEVAEIIGVSTSTFNDWMRAKKYPRIDKIEMLASLFHIMKSDLIEEKAESHKRMQKKNDTLSDIVLKLNEDMELLEMVETLSALGFEQREAVKTLLHAFSKVDR
jgi:transcriptional regulator with XRE-family HTH domain